MQVQVTLSIMLSSDQLHLTARKIICLLRLHFNNPTRNTRQFFKIKKMKYLHGKIRDPNFLGREGRLLAGAHFTSVRVKLLWGRESSRDHTLAQWCVRRKKKISNVSHVLGETYIKIQHRELTLSVRQLASQVELELILTRRDNKFVDSNMGPAHIQHNSRNYCLFVFQSISSFSCSVFTSTVNCECKKFFMSHFSFHAEQSQATTTRQYIYNSRLGLRKRENNFCER